MKNWILAIAMVVVLVGCNSEGNDTVHTNSNGTNVDHAEQNENTNNNIDANDNTDEVEEIHDGENEDSQEINQPTQEEEVVGEVEPQYEMSSDWSFKPIGDANEMVALLTIDDAPDKYALEMAKKLKELNAPAIFFVNGHFLDTDEEKTILKEIHEMGFEIGNHTYNHTNLGTIDDEAQRKEIEELSSLVEEIIGEKPRFFRAPNGTNTDFAKQFVKEEGMLLMNWTYGYDYFKPYMDAEKLKEAMITGKGPEVDVPYSLLKPGANLLMHDREWTNEALEDIVIGLREQGYELLNPKLIKTPTN
ncbi:polysaccharide deacetylase family protein [Bacillaceae bacterium S4-13-58]